MFHQTLAAKMATESKETEQATLNTTLNRSKSMSDVPFKDEYLSKAVKSSDNIDVSSSHGLYMHVASINLWSIQ